MKPSTAPNSRSQFAGHSYDAFLVLERVIPVALKKGKPGTQEFREGIRQALLTEREIAASQGVYNFTEKDRYGLDDALAHPAHGEGRQVHAGEVSARRRADNDQSRPEEAGFFCSSCPAHDDGEFKSKRAGAIVSHRPLIFERALKASVQLGLDLGDALAEQVVRNLALDRL